MRQKTKKKRIFQKRSLPSETRKDIRTLMEKRKARVKKALKSANIGAAAGFGASLHTSLSKNYSFVERVAFIPTVAATTGGIMGVARYAASGKEVKKATKLVGKGLAQVAKQNKYLRDLLGNYSYVIVDRKGNIKGTNSKRVLGIGRLRLESNKILTENY